MLTGSTREHYTSWIIKAGALLADTRAFLVNWDVSQSIEQNLDRFRRDNIFGKATRARVEDILIIFQQRYLVSESVTRALVALARSDVPPEGLDRILYFHAAMSDRLLHDVVTEILMPSYVQGRTCVSTEEIREAILRWIGEGKTVARWSDSTTRRVSQGVSSTLRDFGVLRGAVNKELATPFLPVYAFAYVAFYLRRSQPSGERLLKDPEWRLFFLSRDAVERLFMEAHQRRFLEYHAAASVVRIDFPTESIEEYADVIAARAH